MSDAEDGSGAVLTGYGTKATGWSPPPSADATNNTRSSRSPSACATNETVSSPPVRRRSSLRRPHPLDAGAEKYLRGHRDTPSVTMWADADATALLDAGVSRGTGLLPLLAEACLVALGAFPALNSRVVADHGEIVRQPRVHLGFAAQTGQGLVVPAVRAADRLSPDQLAAELRRLTALARQGTLPLDLRTGGTFTLNNYGVLDVDGATPILNHPQAAMLGVGRITDRPWAVDGRVEVRKVVHLALTFDHRVCDGGTAAGFLRHVVGGVTDLTSAPRTVSDDTPLSPATR